MAGVLFLSFSRRIGSCVGELAGLDCLENWPLRLVPDLLLHCCLLICDIRAFHLLYELEPHSLSAIGKLFWIKKKRENSSFLFLKCLYLSCNGFSYLFVSSI